MKTNINEYYKEVKNKFLSECNQCGQCITKCPVIKYTDICNSNPKNIQRDIIKFFKTGELSQDAYTKVYSCMECFKCIGNKHCPKDINTMTINEIVKWEQQKIIIQNNLDNDKDDYINQKILASIQVSKEEYQTIFTPTEKENAEYVFFTGCNVYKQPEKILNAIDIISMITKDYAFVPGINYCCGDLYNNHGYPQKATKVYNKLIEKISSYSPKKLILWCPTCSCRFAINTKIKDIPFEIVTFGQFVAENMDKLRFIYKSNKIVTLHEACKTSYMGIDLESVRKILTSIPNIKLIEMKHHGKDTICCGSEVREHNPKSADLMKVKRLKEAQDVNPDILIDVCQFCHDTFSADELKFKFKIENYVNFIAQSLGINREDKYKKYKQWKNIDRIMDDAKEFIYDSPYTKEQVISVLKNLFSIT